jgi:hypothetical protein
MHPVIGWKPGKTTQVSFQGRYPTTYAVASKCQEANGKHKKKQDKETGSSKG